MDILENFQTFLVKEKVGMLQPDKWVIYSSYTTKEDTFYKVMYDSQTDVRPVGMINHSTLVNSFNEGNIELLGMKKFKKKDLEKGKK